MEPRIVDLEIRYTHLERQVHELSAVIFEQQKAIDGLLQQVKSLRERFGDAGVRAEHEKPPHY